MEKARKRSYDDAGFGPGLLSARTQPNSAYHNSRRTEDRWREPKRYNQPNDDRPKRVPTILELREAGLFNPPTYRNQMDIPPIRPPAPRPPFCSNNRGPVVHVGAVPESWNRPQFYQPTLAEVRRAGYYSGLGSEQGKQLPHIPNKPLRQPRPPPPPRRPSPEPMQFVEQRLYAVNVRTQPAADESQVPKRRKVERPDSSGTGRSRSQPGPTNHRTEPIYVSSDESDEPQSDSDGDVEIIERPPSSRPHPSQCKARKNAADGALLANCRDPIQPYEESSLAARDTGLCGTENKLSLQPENGNTTLLGITPSELPADDGPPLDPIVTTPLVEPLESLQLNEEKQHGLDPEAKPIDSSSEVRELRTMLANLLVKPSESDVVNLEEKGQKSVNDGETEGHVVEVDESAKSTSLKDPGPKSEVQGMSLQDVRKLQLDLRHIMIGVKEKMRTRAMKQRRS